MSREKNDGNTYSRSFQFVLKIQAADAGKPHIQNQATGTVTMLSRLRTLVQFQKTESAGRPTPAVLEETHARQHHHRQRIRSVRLAHSYLCAPIQSTVKYYAKPLRSVPAAMSPRLYRMMRRGDLESYLRIYGTQGHVCTC